MTTKSLLNRIGIGRGSGANSYEALPGHYAAATDLGLKRSANQDQALAMKLPNGALLLAVADGVGGASGGEVAAALAIEELAHEFSRGIGDDDIGGRLIIAFAQANRRVLATGSEFADLEGLATTLVAALIVGSKAWIANVGDSRAYLLEEWTLRTLTDDHTWTADRVRAGKMTSQEAANSPFSNVITRGIGVADAIVPDVRGPFDLGPGSTVLLCSDGLHRPASDHEIANELLAGAPDDRAGRLIALANRHGGPDNIGVAVYEVTTT